VISLKKAKKIIEEHQKKWPVPIVSIAREMGLDIYKVKEWPTTVSGKLQKNERGSFSIYVNERHPKGRQRFTIAHEIAHFVWHADWIEDGIVDDGLYRSEFSNAIEAKANSYAVDILMPWHLIDEAIKQGGDTVEKLANMFDVSKSTISIRLGIPFEEKEYPMNY